jgi:two-component system, sensor histidine kinase and response regulator
MSDTLNVLVVDDEPGMQTGVERALRDFSVAIPDVNQDVRFTVDTASTGEDGLRKITEHPPHILLLDHKLPGISGLKLLDRLQGKDYEMLTIMITAYATLETAVTATKRGAYDFLAKPFTPAELRNVVQKAAARLLLAREARRLVKEKRQVRFQFISVLAHELKSPLGAIEGYLRMIKDRTAGADQAVYDQVLDRSLVRLEGMRKMIMDLLDLTRIESGQKQREIARVDLKAVAESVIEANTGEAASRSITIRLAPPPQPVELEADRGELEIMVNNLVSNAVKYNRDGGRVDVSYEAADGFVTVRVADTGIGMTEAEAAKLFNDFVRIKNEKTKSILGSGLGLSIVKKLALLNGGDVSVTSKPDVGSTFSLRLRQSQKPAV